MTEQKHRCVEVDGRRLYPLLILRDLPFALHSLWECCTEPGSYKRSVAREAIRGIEGQIKDVMAALKAAGWTEE